MLAHRWWPVLVWLGVIRLESTDFASAENTSTVLYTVIATVAPQVQESFVSQLDEVLRKTGHFTGYGILSGLVFLALKNTNYDRLRPLLKPALGKLLARFLALGLGAARHAGYHRDRCGRRDPPDRLSRPAPDDGRTSCSIPAAPRCAGDCLLRIAAGVQAPTGLSQLGIVWRFAPPEAVHPCPQASGSRILSFALNILLSRS